MKKYKIIIAILAIIIAAGGYWYVRKNNGQDQKKIAFSTGFTLLDDEKNLVWSETVELSPEARARFESKVKEIKADLAAAKEKDQLLADYNNLAIYQKYLGNYREAYGAYLESLKLESRARVAWQNFADVLLNMKAYKSAEMAYKKAIELNQYIPESYNKLADYYKAVGDGKNVEATYKLALETIKQSTESDTLVLDAYAEWLAEQKRYNEAIKIYEQLMVKQPNNKAAIQRKIEGLGK
ncbi:MAG: hypothetical protein Q7R92_01090 [bacterium]|nr:hypothetical protein [bacterium]